MRRKRVRRAGEECAVGEPANTPQVLEPITADPATRANAQTLLDAAEKRLAKDGTGRYEVTWGLEGYRVTTEGRFSLNNLNGPVADVTLTQPSSKPGNRDTRVREVLIGADAYSLVTVDGKDQACWYHTTRDHGPDAKVLAITPPVLMLLEPKAAGMASSGDASDVVVNIALDEATSVVFPKIANPYGGQIATPATIPARVELLDGNYKTITFRIRDVFVGLTDVDIDASKGMPSEMRDQLAALLTFSEVRVDYSKFGSSVSVEPPEKDLIVETDGVTTDDELKPCAAAK